MSGKDVGEQIAELYMVDHRHGEEHSYVLRLTAEYLTLVPLDEEGNRRAEAQQGLGGRLIGGLRSMFGAKGPMTPHAILDTDLRLDDNGIRIRMGSNAFYSYQDFNPVEARKFLVAYLQAKGNLMKKG